MKIQDIWLAAYLLANGAELVAIERGYWSTFVFRDNDTVVALVDDYRNGNPTMDVRRFARACKDIRRAARDAA
jgi:hypothetical protein